MKHSVYLIIAILLVSSVSSNAGKEVLEIPLTARGKELLETYTKQLETLRAEVIAALPQVNDAKKAQFLEIRAK